MQISLCILFTCFYMVKIVKKLRIHQFYSLNPHFYISSIHSPLKNTPKHQVYTLAKHFKTCFQVISLFKRLFSPLWLEVPNPQKQRKYRLFQPLSFVIRAIHSTCENQSFSQTCQYIVIPILVPHLKSQYPDNDQQSFLFRAFFIQFIHQSQLRHFSRSP